MRSPHLFAAGVMAGSLLLAPCRAASGNEFTLSIRLQAGTREQTVVSGQAANSRPAFSVKAKEVLWVRWSAVNGPASPTLSDVTLHVFLDRADARSEPLKPGPNALFESALIVDFEPGGKSSGEFRMPMREAGSYVLRVETIGAGKKLGNEKGVSSQVVVR